MIIRVCTLRGYEFLLSGFMINEKPKNEKKSFNFNAQTNVSIFFRITAILGHLLTTIHNGKHMWIEPKIFNKF